MEPGDGETRASPALPARPSLDLRRASVIHAIRGRIVSAWRSAPIAWSVLAVGITASILGWLLAGSLAEREALLHFERQSQDLFRSIVQSLAAQDKALEGLQRWASATGELSEAQLRRYADSLPGTDGYGVPDALGFARLVPASRHGAGASGADHGDPSLESIIAVRDSTGGMEPNLLFQPAARETMEHARDSGGLVASGRLTPAAGTPPLVLLVRAVYRPSLPVATVDQRRAAVSGMVFSLVDLGHLVRSAAPRTLLDQAALEVHEGDAGSPIARPWKPASAVLGTGNSSSGRPDPRKQPGSIARFRTEHAFAFGGRQWRLMVLSLSDFPAAASGFRWVVLVLGLLASALLTRSAWNDSRNRNRAVTRAVALSRDLRASEGRINRIVASLGEAIWSLSLPERRLTYLSPAAGTVFGPRADRLYDDADPWRALAHPDDIVLIDDFEIRLAETGSADVEFRIRPGGDGTRWIRQRAWLIKDESGQPLRVDGIASDVTLRRGAEVELRRLSGAVEQTRTSVMITDPQGVIEYVNSGFSELTGFQPEETVGQTPRLLKSGLNDPGLYESLWHTVKEGRIWSGEILNRNKNGELFWVHEVVSPVRDRDGRITHYVAMKQDITDRKRTERALADTESLFRTALDSVPDLFTIYGPDRSIWFANERMLSLSGLTLEDVAGRRDEDIFPPPHAEAYLPALRRAMESGSPQSVECTLEYPTAGRIALAMDFIPVFDAQRVLSQVLCVARDVTQHAEHKKSLDRMNRTLRVLSDCSQALVHASDESELLDSVCSTMVNVGGYDLVWVGLAVNDAARTVRPAMQAGHRRPHPDLVTATWGQDPLGLGPTGTAIRTGQPALCRDIASDASLAPWQGAAAEHSLRSCAAIPMVHAGETIGSLTIYASEARLFDAREMELLKELADDVTFGIMTRRAAAAGKQAEDLLRLRDRVIESSSNGILINDLTRPNNPIIYVNPAFERMTGYTAKEVTGRNPRFLIRADRDQAGLERIRIALREKCEGRAILRSYHKDGTMFWVELSMSPVTNDAGEATHFVTILNDVTERQLYQEELEHQAYHDALTGLANRNLLPDRIRQSILHAHRSNQTVAVLLLDLDHFKLVNDSLGHAVGDSLLVSVAERLTAAVREVDTVARIGGDEFVVVLADAEREEHITTATQRVMDAVVEPLVIKGKEFYVTASIGVSVYPRDGQDAETLLKNADVAMYRAKEHGRNNYQFYTPEMNARLTERINMVSGLRRALKRNEFRLYFQPLVEVRSGQVTAVEVLTHWHHPQRGVVSPSVFIPVTEETGLIRPLGEWVLRGACEQARQWQDMGFPGIVVAVNLSANQFRQKNLTELVERALNATGLDPGSLELELTESVVMHNVDEVLSTLRDLKSIGVNISLDDFGTGYSSLSYLKRFPIDKLKIDRTFVRDIITNPEDAAIARAVIAMAHSLDMRVVAEGVETAEQLDFLRANHCDMFQGFFYARPLSANESTDLLRSQWIPKAVTGAK